jgi:alpha-tubulin suppressor-like RCC1 family protein
VSAASGERSGAIAVPSLNTATAIAVGESFGCAMRHDVTLVCWGANAFGQLGTPEVTAAARPVMLTGVAWPVAVSAGSFHACAIRRDGRVRCWGRSHVGQLGRTATRDFSTVPVTVDGVAQAAGISVGGRHACAVLVDGTVKCWGSNETGQLGRDPALKFSHTTLEIDLSR